MKASTRNVAAAWVRLPNKHCPELAADTIRCNLIMVTYNLYVLAYDWYHRPYPQKRQESCEKQYTQIAKWNSICMWHFNTPGKMDVFVL